jgi:hypothetical protein
MFCDRCGAKLNDGQSFCPACGKAAGTIPLMPRHSRIAGHVRLLGIFWLAAAAFRLIAGFAVLIIFGGSHWLPPDVPTFVYDLLLTVGYLHVAAGALSIATGWGLLDRQPWARTLAIVLGCFSLLDVPFGTALGVYTLWVLLPAKSEEEYNQIARAA